MQALDHLLSVSADGLTIHHDSQAIHNNVQEWFANAQFTIADNPAWGHNLSPFRFAPQNEDTAVALEISIVKKLSQDVEGLSIQGIRVSWPAIDVMQVVIRHQMGATNLQLSNKEL
ncbi:hypothetical protein H0A36_25715 [Endozoicomonas sp. SM1973]|uniref:Uncharacterized protein n=1 Tax=Spartinivicinus marinus TaxID=2994442 RepID=A0A853IJ39_9GAMM|nr:hypothetical protein [Spartinivicinus marinus]MCX4030461.1 hypothetical protein [Spartinivicinus marinus]NYZ69417.1 hypothetical protein [Spartinivicinus marinus]